MSFYKTKKWNHMHYPSSNIRHPTDKLNVQFYREQMKQTWLIKQFFPYLFNLDHLKVISYRYLIIMYLTYWRPNTTYMHFGKDRRKEGIKVTSREKNKIYLNIPDLEFNFQEINFLRWCHWSMYYWSNTNQTLMINYHYRLYTGKELVSNIYFHENRF